MCRQQINWIQFVTVSRKKLSCVRLLRFVFPVIWSLWYDGGHTSSGFPLLLRYFLTCQFITVNWNEVERVSTKSKIIRKHFETDLRRSKKLITETLMPESFVLSSIPSPFWQSKTQNYTSKSSYIIETHFGNVKTHCVLYVRAQFSHENDLGDVRQSVFLQVVVDVVTSNFSTCIIRSAWEKLHEIYHLPIV